MPSRLVIVLSILVLAACSATPARHDPPAATYDVILRGGMVYDGSGLAGRVADVGLRGDRIAAIGDLAGQHAAREVDVQGLAVAPGFINVLSWANDSLLADGRGLSDLKQGVTLEIFGEGWSYGPYNDALKAEQRAQQSDIRYEIDWNTLGEYLDRLVARGVSPNVASFVGATTIRQYVLGNANRAPDAVELARMQALVREAMAEGALGVGSSLIYAPAAYARTDELVALAAAAAESGGGYISHLRSEGDRLLEALDELIGIARATGVHAEVYHLKAAGEANWPKMAEAIARIEAARREGLAVSADMYAYTAAATGLDACLDPAVQEGGRDALVQRLKKPEIRREVVAAMRAPGHGWENLCQAAGSAERILLLGFDKPELKPLTGRTLALVARESGTSPEDTVVDLIIADRSRVDTAFFLMSEDNVKLGLAQPWVSLGSDEGAYAPEGVFLLRQPHPRAYGNVARFLGRYVREAAVTTLPEAIRRLTSLPAENWKLEGRGRLAPGHYADVVVFDPVTIADTATFERPQQFAVGVREVFVNGVPVIVAGEYTGLTPGRVVRGPGYRGKAPR